MHNEAKQRRFFLLSISLTAREELVTGDERKLIHIVEMENRYSQKKLLGSIPRSIFDRYQRYINDFNVSKKNDQKANFEKNITIFILAL